MFLFVQNICGTLSWLELFAGNFIGYLFAEDKNMSVELVKEGLAKMHFTAERGKYFDHLSRLEDREDILSFRSIS